MRREDRAVGEADWLVGAGGGPVTTYGPTRSVVNEDTFPVAPRARTHATDDELERLAAVLAKRQPTRYERYVKPLLDRVLAAALLLLVIPVLLAVTIAVVVIMGRPVLFRQLRAGQHGRAFKMFKFRTMRPDRRVSCDGYTGPERRMTHKTSNDPRHTPLGRWMRKLSLDELPQLLNVLLGDMSLVGPRPELIDLTAGYQPWQHSRHLVRPGVTGLWQTTERGNGLLLHECIDMDLEYIDGLSFARDCEILARTPLATLRNKGVV
jgi:lipopolysaccharide/colanic/teichoic acid biosynthesis glycosyltransferase